jgi:hypothetical protein
METMVLAALAGTALILYMTRRRKRLTQADE